MEYAFGTSTSSGPLANAACAGAFGFPRAHGLRPPDRAIHDRSPLSLRRHQHGPEFFDREHMEQFAFPYGTRLLTSVAIVIHSDITETATLVPAVGTCPAGRFVPERRGLDGGVQNDPGIALRRKQTDEAQPSLKHLPAARGSEK